MILAPDPAVAKTATGKISVQNKRAELCQDADLIWRKWTIDVID